MTDATIPSTELETEPPAAGDVPGGRGALGPRPAASSSRPTTAWCKAVDDVTFDVLRERDARHRRRVGLGQERHVAGDPGPAAEDGARSPATSTSGAEPARPAREASCSTLRGEKIAMVFQDALAALNPVYTVGDQIAEAIDGPPRPRRRTSVRDRVRRAARPRRHPEPERAGRPVPARVLRRHAPAGDDRDGDRQRPRRADRRRAHHRARRHHPGPGARGARAHPGPHAARRSCSSPTTSASSPASPTGCW